MLGHVFYHVILGRVGALDDYTGLVGIPPVEPIADEFLRQNGGSINIAVTILTVTGAAINQELLEAQRQLNQGAVRLVESLDRSGLLFGDGSNNQPQLQ